MQQKQKTASRRIGNAVNEYGVMHEVGKDTSRTSGYRVLTKVSFGPSKRREQTGRLQQLVKGPRINLLFPAAVMTLCCDGPFHATPGTAFLQTTPTHATDSRGSCLQMKSQSKPRLSNVTVTYLSEARRHRFSRNELTFVTAIDQLNDTILANFEEAPTLLAPPSYLASTSESSSEAAAHGRSDIAPRYIAWQIVLTAFLAPVQTDAADDLDKEEESATALLEVLYNVRLVSRLLYSVSMSLLRPMYFPEYLKAISATVYSTNLTRSNLDLPCREMRVLDHYISYRINRRHLATRSSLLLINDDLESDQRQVSQDLFKWLQPQTYMEDEIGKVLSSSDQGSNGARFEDMLVRFHFTRAAITLPFAVESSLVQSATSAPSTVRKECVMVERSSNEPVFITAHRLVDLLKRLVFVRKAYGGKSWYELVGQAG
ncbi:hypothetical protein PHSY_001528 [Pseudozyma hubeiensis SY62]|uniref:Uncharacterized protein n=1 Tax=Pseudozyma hubeiensis (strain SY62) TaxID=1305764 RepID=R9NYZ1_PSEHS|nr:hypothetical protein PHSY_001528 [Pseudozyma hubeiensis SY62]GAC93959.1 hypothetical protein PHSY_001528 [Pseudozyma hubeiensis SY62]